MLCYFFVGTSSLLNPPNMKKLLLYLLMAALFGAALFWIISQKPASRETVARPVATLTAEELYRQFYEDENLANEKYLNKTIRITGPMKDVLTDDAGFQTVILGNSQPLAKARLRKDLAEFGNNLNVGDELILICTCMGLVETVELRDCRVEE